MSVIFIFRPEKTGLKINITDNKISPKVGDFAYLIFILCRQVFFRIRKEARPHIAR